MKFDLRFPIGIMFSLFGAILAVYGLVSDKAIYDKSLGININFRWGIVLLAFGVFMLTLAFRRLGRGSGEEPGQEAGKIEVEKPKRVE